MRETSCQCTGVNVNVSCLINKTWKGAVYEGGGRRQDHALGCFTVILLLPGLMLSCLYQLCCYLSVEDVTDAYQ